MRDKIKIRIRAQVHDKNGRLLKLFPWRNANSLLNQFIDLLAVQLTQTAQLVRCTDGVAASTAAAGNSFDVTAAANVTTRGILIGTGTTAVTMADYMLAGQVVTNIAHAVVTFVIESIDSTARRISITRKFTNNTGSTLSIKEVALYHYNTNVAKYVCLDRTLYAVSVPVNTDVTLTYQITISL